MKTLSQLDNYCQYWFTKSMQWADELWSEENSLLRVPLDRDHEGKNEQVYYTVRDSIWYATGLFMRQNQGDIERALRILKTILTFQFNDPSAEFHGTFFRYPGEPYPNKEAVVWRDFDPNWREFICTVFIILLKEYGDLLPVDLQSDMQDSILLATEGAFERKVAAEYTNISLMSAFLLDFAGAIFNKPAWREYALSQANAIYELFNRTKTFNEYNSPTYYGVDLYALGLWRKYGANEVYRSLGASMEADLWRDISQFYHADMRNMCGPYDRSYGMDMTDYIAVLGLWIAVVLPNELAPLPDVNQLFNHSADYFFSPMVALIGSQPPDDVMPYFTNFQNERLIEHIIEPNRSVSAWLSKTLMLGAEADYLNTTRSNQFHPVTVHWKALDGTTGWIRTRCENLIQATTNPYELRLFSVEPIKCVFEIHVSESSSDMIEPDRWLLPGLTVQFDTSQQSMAVQHEDNLLTVQLEFDTSLTMIFSIP